MTSNNSDHYNRTGMRAFIFSISFSLLFMAYLSFFHPIASIDQVRLEDQKGKEKAATSGTEKTAEKSFDPQSIAKPWQFSDELAAHGKKIFDMNCVACHGKEGKGDGPAANGIVPPPRNLVEGKWTKGGSSKELFSTITNGISGTSMAPFGHLSIVDRWALVHYIRSITQNKPTDNATDLEQFASSAK